MLRITFGQLGATEVSEKKGKPEPAASKPAPQRIPARGEGASTRPKSGAAPTKVGAPEQKKNSRISRRWLGALIAALLVVGALGVAAFVHLSGDSDAESADAQIRTSIQSFTEALSGGDLSTLRSSSCGDLATYYRELPEEEFADVHRAAVEQGNIPVVDNIEAVQINGDTAIAQVIAYTEANPGERSPRTFDLRLVEEEWKVC